MLPVKKKKKSNFCSYPPNKQNGLATLITTNSTDVTCNEMDPYTGVPYFPETATNYSVNGTIVYTPCTVVNATLLNACKPPLVEGVNDGCFLTCTLPSLSDNQYLSAKILQGVVSWLSWVCCVVAWQLGDIRLHYFISF